MISRRNFLRGAAATTALVPIAAIVKALPASEAFTITGVDQWGVSVVEQIRLYQSVHTRALAAAVMETKEMIMANLLNDAVPYNPDGPFLRDLIGEE